MNKELQDKARSEIRAKMEAKPFVELEKDWARALNYMYGLNPKKAVTKAVYRSLSRSAIIFFEEFLKMDDERRSNERRAKE